MRRLRITDAEIMKVALQQEIVRSQDARYDHRLHGVLLVCTGHSCYDVADLLGHSTRAATVVAGPIAAFRGSTSCRPTAPDLNPVERVWKLTRRLCTHNRYFETLEDLLQIVHDQFTAWHHPNRQLHRLCAII